MGISLALICDAQSLCLREDEHFLVKSSKLSKIFVWSSSCKASEAEKIKQTKIWKNDYEIIFMTNILRMLLEVSHGNAKYFQANKHVKDVE